MSATHFNLSQELATFLDLESKNVPRHKIVRKVCEYVKENQLVDNDNKIVYRCDNELHHFMKKDTFAAFSIIRDLKDHLEEVTEEETYPNEVLLQNQFGEMLSLRAYQIGDQRYICINNFEVPEETFIEYIREITNSEEEEKRDYKIEMLISGFFLFTILSLWLAVLFGNWK